MVLKGGNECMRVPTTESKSTQDIEKSQSYIEVGSCEDGEYSASVGGDRR